MKLRVRGQLTDVIMCVKFLVDRFRGYGVLIPPKLQFPIDLLRRPYNSVELPCDTVNIDISIWHYTNVTCVYLQNQYIRSVLHITMFKSISISIKEY